MSKDYKFKEINLDGITSTKGDLEAHLRSVASRAASIAISRGHKDVRVTTESRPQAGLVAIVGTYDVAGDRREAKYGGLAAGAQAVGKLRRSS